MSETTQMPAGRELDERVCSALGIDGRREFYASADGGKSGMYFSDFRSEVEDFIADYRRRLPDSEPARCEVFEVMRYPRVSEEMGAAGLVVEKMRERWAQQDNAKRGEPDVWQFHDFADEGWRASVVWLHHDGAIVEVDEIAPTLPHAICLATLAAVTVEDVA